MTVIRRGAARVAVVFAVLLAVVLAYNADLIYPRAVQHFVLDFGILAPLIWIALYLVAVFIPYGTSVLTIAAGLAFGVIWGSVLVYVTTVFASLIPMLVSRRLGQRWVESKIDKSRLKKYVDLINRHAFLVFFYLRLLPTIPYEVQNYIAGVTRISYVQFFLASLLGDGPVLFIMVFFGDGLTDPGSPRFWVAAGLYLLIIVSPVIIVLVHRGKDRDLLVETTEG